MRNITFNIMIASGLVVFILVTGMLFNELSTVQPNIQKIVSNQ